MRDDREPTADRAPVTGDGFPGSGRRVLVTGAAGGLGRALVRAFAANGDRVALHYGSRRAEAEETAAGLPGTGHTVLGADLTDAARAGALVEAAADALGGIDVLVNNAAARTAAHPPAGTPAADWIAAWERHVAVNLLAPAHLSHAAAQRMIAQGGGGRIVNVGSRGAFRGEPDHPAYGATKAGLHALGQSLAVALGPHGIAVASVAPGFIDTDRVAHRLSGAEGEAIRSQSPFGRVAVPEDVAAAVLWLASPQAQWSSGTVLDVNGASYLRT
ncbi:MULTISPECIES: SDR family NAD(P)-dependent oxidoreductase [unclassified Streptomyces]|uniref:SDR family NAD(P)-dependent oxidoreductase n=1 Tax=unclassified Streptomyces TaxID=2593676 RepID=UPI0022B7344C|nr:MULTISPECIES: SDR family oxidoreductase [unclassified Streptomyces]MCZ7416495.1 SDR family NAD(P)-dependent oxidoreductase [Streptomyces sp. WMMC897]MCZ7433694.1 SDR family NAD(P)-dependent oxidoreductase [Streptomyces sp. WMMC1477]